MASVSGVVVSWASMVKVRSNTDRDLQSGREFEDAAVVPPAAASMKPTGISPSRWAGSEMAQPSIMLIRVQLRRARRFCRGERLVVGESAMRGGVFAVVGSTNAS